VRVGSQCETTTTKTAASWLVVLELELELEVVAVDSGLPSSGRLLSSQPVFEGDREDFSFLFLV
jgi:hypothetical protein